MRSKGSHTRQLLLLVLASSACFWAQADTYYVDGASGQDTYAGTEFAPWKTISRANWELVSGDTVLIRGGFYENDPIAPRRSGTSGSPIEYKAYPGEEPIITNTDTGIILNKRDYIIVDGITVDGQANGQKAFGVANVDHFAFINDGNYNIIRNSTMRDAHGWAGIHMSNGSHHNKLLNNVFDNIGTNNDGVEDHGDMLVIKCANFNLVEGNTFSRGGHNLFEVMGLSNVLRDNTFDNQWDNFGAGSRIGDLNTNEKYNCPPAQERGNTLFEGNVLRNAAATADDPENTALKVQGNRNIVRRNIFINNISNVFQSALREPEHVETRSNRIYNNTLYDNGSFWTARSYGRKTFSAEDNEFKNNIIAEMRSQRAIHVDWLSRADAISNSPLNENRLVSNAFHGVSQVKFRVIGIGTESLHWFESNYSDLVSGNILSDPQFLVSKPSERSDFELSPSSPMIDAAAHLTTTASSGSGKILRVEDAGYFFGSIASEIYRGDEIMVGFSGLKSRVVAVDYEANELVLDNPISWAKGDPVNLIFSGTAPDLGALEYGESGSVRRPRAPIDLTVVK